MNESTISNPLAFFEYFFRDKGFSVYRFEFINFDCAGADMIYDAENEVITYQAIISEEGDWATITKDFKKELFRKLLNEKEEVIKHIDSQIGNSTTKEGKQAALVIITSKLEFLSNKINNYTEALNYPDNKNTVKEIEEYLTKIYSDLFLPNVLKNATSNMPKLKVNLSVYDLSALFRILFEDNLIVLENKIEIGRFISEHFETKKATKISPDSANNKFNTPEPPSLDYWNDKFLQLRSVITKLQEK